MPTDEEIKAAAEKAASDKAAADKAAADALAAKPPWGTPEEFDPAKAWDLIKNLREQKNDPAVAKELSELRAAKKAAEDANRTEVEKERARADTAEAALSKSAAEKLRADVAIDKKLTASQAKRLVGSTREELEADAVEMLADLKGPVVPSADGQGGAGGSVHADGDRSAVDIVAEATKR